ncbi:hypothetical protein [uncultured Microscilla sp.]|uniref:hypothetical protein n=1 Tax=uncultured Microscilla sp. TaxID=432653 RepID=UPI002612DF17|nr:hypothetical protein [uncultured Microscilla sp.]
MQVCYQNEYALIEFDEDSSILMLTWNKFVKGDKFRDTITKFYDLTVEKKVQSWCFDSRKQRVVAPDDQKWTVDEMVQRELHLKSIKTAIIMPDSLFMELSVEKISDSIEKQTDNTSEADDNRTRQFQDKDPALAWLRSDV